MPPPNDFISHSPAMGGFQIAKKADGSVLDNTVAIEGPNRPIIVNAVRIEIPQSGGNVSYFIAATGLTNPTPPNGLVKSLTVAAGTSSMTVEEPLSGNDSIYFLTMTTAFFRWVLSGRAGS